MTKGAESADLAALMERLEKSAAGSDLWRTPGCPHCGEAATALSEREREIARLRDCLSDTQGRLHNINYEASMIRQWADDPNCKVKERAARIEALRLETHRRINVALRGLSESASQGTGETARKSGKDT